MNVRALILGVLLALPGLPALAQGFADMGRAADGFALPRPGPFAFPADHGAHPDFRIEWWYLTASLSGPDGTPYGAQWTLFRTALAPGEGEGWSSPQLWMGHAAVTTPDRHLYAERLARGGIGQAGVTAEPFSAWIDDWQMTGRAEPGADALSALDLTARGDAFSYALSLDATGPIVAQGDITVAGETIPVTGQAWLDREWSSQPLAPDQKGWDWFSLMFEDGSRLMGFRLRDAGEGFTSATWIAADGVPSPMPPGALRVSPLREADVADRSVPVEWRVELPAKGLDVTVTALNPGAWMGTLVPYWEGPITITGSHAGRGYLEMTGY